MSAPRAVPCNAATQVTITAPVTHLCPHVNEVDEGTVEIGWTTSGATIELHSLAAHLRSYATQRISHEELAADIAEALALPGVAAVTVTARFTTAGLDMEVMSGAVPGDALVGAGA